MTTHRSTLRRYLTLLCVVLTGLTFAQTGIPKVVDPVTDLTNTLDKIQYTNLRKQIIQFEDSTSNQIVVLMLPTLAGDEIRDFGIKVLEQNKIGQQGKDNGILILIAKDDRKAAIEVGYGLEGVMTDAVSVQIINDEMKPNFREGKYYEGISAAINTIMLVTKGEYTANKKKKKKDSGWFGVLIIAAVILFSAFGMRRNKYGITSRGRNNIWWGGGGFGGGYGSGGGFGSFGGGGGGGGWSAGGGSFGGGGASGSW